MNCPWCTDLNLTCKTILLSGFYVCENENCNFCESEEYFGLIKTVPNDSLNDSPNCEFSQFFENEINGFDITDNYVPDIMLIDNTTANGQIESNMKLIEMDTEIINNVDKNISNTLKTSSLENLYDSINVNTIQQLNQTKTVENKLQKNDLINIVDLNSSILHENKSEEIISDNEENYNNFDSDNNKSDIEVESSNKVIKMDTEIINDVDKNILPNTEETSSLENLFDSVDGNNIQILNQTKTAENESKKNELIEIIDLNSSILNENNSEEIFSADKENEVKLKSKKSRTKSKLSVIDQSISHGLDLNFYHYNNKLFNWLRMPYLMKTHSKIIRILLLHLDIFKFPDRACIDDIKREYSVCETLANQFRIDTVRSLCYQFLNKLYNIIDKIPDKNLVNKEMDERVLCLLKNVFDKYDSSNSLKFEYKTELCCRSCHSVKSIESKEYILLMDNNKSHLKIHENKLIYEINCLKCTKKSMKTVLFTNVPQFVIFHCPKGLKEDISRYENKIVNRDGNKLSVVAVIETGSKYPFVEVPENQMSWHSYDICDTIMDTRCRPSYCVHFRNKFGWFSLNGYKQFLCSPQDTLSIYSLSDVRFIIFGEISDPHVYRNLFSVQDLINKYEDIFKKSISESIEKSKLDSHNNTVIEKPNKKSSKPKSKRKIKWKKSIKIEENNQQFPRILKRINCDIQNESSNDENGNISEKNSLISNQNNFSSSNNLIPAGNIEAKNMSSRNKSSNESSILENYGFTKKKKLENNEIVSQSTTSINFLHKEINSEFPRELFTIDDLINKQCKKLSKNL